MNTKINAANLMQHLKWGLTGVVLDCVIDREWFLK